MPNRRLRVALSLVAGISMLLAVDHVFATDVGFMVLATAIVVFGILEFCEMHRTDRIHPPRTLPCCFGALLILSTWWKAHHGPLTAAGVDIDIFLLVAAVLALILGTLPGGPGNRSAGAAISLFGLLYVYLLLSFVVRLRLLPGVGEAALLYLLIVAKGADSAAFAVGRTLGKHRLAPLISPAKTVEGAIGGTAAGTGLGVLCGWLFGFLAWTSIPVLAGVSLGLSLAGQLGDLIESMLKRNAGVKDSGAFLREIGGVLDVTDSLTFAGPLAFFFFYEATAGRL